ncbi:hypothetical protein BJF83_15675 [Nocardiopsis sp. CNR-923]|uniref:hypothetical protein n=1 Tax=Nocardiopsis sp. CNR-923 TaxID=1904965 RepID=UPI00095D02B8|nr:hypothetical protein [Nocardiopsis sp. CNR-923]OLT28324.1 hypothetical protein BJF83_15675 [Nocardiopsis sp. CNR-923]
MADTDERKPGAAPSRPARGAWVPLGAATAVIVLLVTVWPLLNAILPGTEDVRAGQTRRISAEGGYEAALTFDRGGWALHPDASAADRTYLFTRGPVELTVRSVVPLEETRPSAADLWHGLGRIVRTDDPAAHLGDPEPVAADDGTPGLTGSLHGAEEGAAAVYPSPDGVFAVEMVLAGPDATSSDLAAVADVLRSVTFTEKGSA